MKQQVIEGFQPFAFKTDQGAFAKDQILQKRPAAAARKKKNSWAAGVGWKVWGVCCLCCLKTFLSVA